MKKKNHLFKINIIFIYETEYGNNKITSHIVFSFIFKKKIDLKITVLYKLY